GTRRSAEEGVNGGLWTSVRHTSAHCMLGVLGGGLAALDNRFDSRAAERHNILGDALHRRFPLRVEEAVVLMVDQLSREDQSRDVGEGPDDILSRQVRAPCDHGV